VNSQLKEAARKLDELCEQIASNSHGLVGTRDRVMPPSCSLFPGIGRMLLATLRSEALAPSADEITEPCATCAVWPL
jgi:hypothetical protein